MSNLQGSVMRISVSMPDGVHLVAEGVMLAWKLGQTTVRLALVREFLERDKVSAEYSEKEYKLENIQSMQTVEGGVDFGETAGMAAGFQTDSEIGSHMKSLTLERELLKWGDSNHVPNDDSSDLNSALEGLAGGWDQFETNRKLFGVVTSFDEHEYTTRIDTLSPLYKQRLFDADKLAREIMGESPHGSKSDVSNIHLAEERGMVFDDSQINEEDRYGAVVRSDEPKKFGNNVSDVNYSRKDQHSPRVIMPSSVHSSKVIVENSDLVSKQTLPESIAESSEKNSFKSKLNPAVPSFIPNPEAVEFIPSANLFYPIEPSFLFQNHSNMHVFPDDTVFQYQNPNSNPSKVGINPKDRIVAPVSTKTSTLITNNFSTPSDSSAVITNDSESTPASFKLKPTAAPFNPNAAPFVISEAPRTPSHPAPGGGGVLPANKYYYSQKTGKPYFVQYRNDVVRPEVRTDEQTNVPLQSTIDQVSKN